jgi:hypothetical protein
VQSPCCFGLQPVMQCLIRKTQRLGHGGDCLRSPTSSPLLEFQRVPRPNHSRRLNPSKAVTMLGAIGTARPLRVTEAEIEGNRFSDRKAITFEKHHRSCLRLRNSSWLVIAGASR